MRLHDDSPGDDEPDDGWVEASLAAPSGTLADVLQTWTVVRRWRGVKAPSAPEAVDATRPQVEVTEDGYQVIQDHDEVRVARGEMGMLYLTRQEIDLARQVFDDQCRLIEGQMHESLEESTRAELRLRFAQLNSLRTAYAEMAEELRRFSG